VVLPAALASPAEAVFSRLESSAGSAGGGLGLAAETSRNIVNELLSACLACTTCVAFVWLQAPSEAQAGDAAADLEALPAILRCACCGVCGTTLQRCARCRSVHYCSRACQQQAWPAHRASCNAATPDTACNAPVQVRSVPSEIRARVLRDALQALQPVMSLPGLLRAAHSVPCTMIVHALCALCALGLQDGSSPGSRPEPASQVAVGDEGATRISSSASDPDGFITGAGNSKEGAIDESKPSTDQSDHRAASTAVPALLCAVAVDRGLSLQHTPIQWSLPQPGPVSAACKAVQSHLQRASDDTPAFVNCCQLIACAALLRAGADSSNPKDGLGAADSAQASCATSTDTQASGLLPAMVPVLAVARALAPGPDAVQSSALSAFQVRSMMLHVVITFQH
jgi:MYND finger